MRIKMKGVCMGKQFIVFGIDRFGESAAKTLEQSGCQVVAVDRSQEKIQQIADDVSYAAAMDVTDPENLKSLALDTMDGAVIALVDEMEASIVVAMTCIEYGIKNIVARAKNEVHGKVLEKIGVSCVVYPERDMGARIGKFLTATDFSDWINLSKDYGIAEMPVPAEWVGRSLAELKLRETYGFNVVGVRCNGDMNMNFSPTQRFTKNMIVYVIGAQKDLDSFRR